MRKPSFRLLFLMAENKKAPQGLGTIWNLCLALQGVFYKYLRNLREKSRVRLLVLLPALNLQLILAQCAECLYEG